MAVLCVAVNLTALAHNISPVQNGVLDLRSHNWKKEGIVNVSGNWEFYWNKFYDPAAFNDSSTIQQRNYAWVPGFSHCRPPAASPIAMSSQGST